MTFRTALFVAGAIVSFAVAPVLAQQDQRLQEMESASRKPAYLSVLDAVPAIALRGELPFKAETARRIAGSRRGCAPADYEFCERMGLLSMQQMERTWDSVIDDRLKRAMYVAIERSSSPTEIDWSKADANYYIWKLEFDEPGYAQKAADLKRRGGQGFVVEANCALDTWTEKLPGGSRIRSRMYCW